LASQPEPDHHLACSGARDLVIATTCSDDVKHNKPAPDTVAPALGKLPGIGAAEVTVVGDTPYDIEAAAEYGIATVALRSGKLPTKRFATLEQSRSTMIPLRFSLAVSTLRWDADGCRSKPSSRTWEAGKHVARELDNSIAQRGMPMETSVTLARRGPERATRETCESMSTCCMSAIIRASAPSRSPALGTGRNAVQCGRSTLVDVLPHMLPASKDTC
jgi:hypothetical protein